MPRPRKQRRCRRYIADRVYKPQGIPLREIETSFLTLDQFEALRLCDIDGLEQEEAGRRMGISRGTIQRLLYSGRRQLMEAILGNNAIVINLQESEEANAGMHSDQRQRRARRHRV